MPHPPRFDDFAAFQAHLDGLGLFHMDLGLDRVTSALNRLGLSRPDCPSVQVAGTNGKGSTSVLLAEMLSAHGMKTGLFTSPHFVSPLERIAVDARPLPEADWLAAANAILAVSWGAPETRLTYFELLTVMAAWLFREHGCRAAVFEAGLGGKSDATTALGHDLTVFAPIGLDHLAVLGPTLADIARDKAQAMRPGRPAVSGPQPTEAGAILKETARALGAPFHRADDLVARFGADWPEAPALPGPHQRDNLRLALAAHALLARARGLPLDAGALRRAAARAFIPGRFQIVRPDTGPELVLDGAHNPAGLECLLQALRDTGPPAAAAVFTCLADKDLAAMAPLAQALTPGRILVPRLSLAHRARDPLELAQALGSRAEPAQGAAQALDAVRELPGRVAVCGSLYLLAEVFALHPEWLARPGATGPATAP